MDDFSGDHWKVQLTKPGKSMTVYFSKGYGHKGNAPRLPEVLECLCTDNADYTFDEFCDCYGYDNDSRKAEKIYKACIKQSKKNKSFFGNTYSDLLDTEF